MSKSAEARRRVERLVAAAGRIVDPTDPLGIEARARLPQTTGLSPEGVELALRECLESAPSNDEIEVLCASVSAAPCTHVLLSANVFVGAHRAIALGLAASSVVSVRASRRDPSLTELLARGAPGLFDVVERLAPAPGDSLWAYGSDATMDAVRATLPPGVAFHPHGSGVGAAVLELGGPLGADIEAVARAIAGDVMLFDQRGCLSPRMVAVVGSESETTRFGEVLARELADGERRVPRGPLAPEEAAAAVRYRDTLSFAGQLFAAGSGLVGVDVALGAVVLPPSGRHVHVVRTDDAVRTLGSIGSALVAIGVPDDARCRKELVAAFPRARFSAPGFMQRPRFDGPVDLRTG